MNSALYAFLNGCFDGRHLFGIAVQKIKDRLDDADKQRKAGLAATAEKRADELIAAGVGPVLIEVLNVGANPKVRCRHFIFSKNDFGAFISRKLPIQRVRCYVLNFRRLRPP